MYLNIRSKILAALIGLPAFAVAQEDDNGSFETQKIAALPYYSYRQGLGMTSPDSTYQLNLRFRIQNRVTYTNNEGSPEAIDAQIRRLRLRFDGYVGDPRFLYALQLSFAPGDVGVASDGKNINIIRDAVVFYRPNNRWNFGFGQTKLPGNRQRINSSGALQFTDRSINNARFNIDRDFGLQVHQSNLFYNSFSISFKGAVSMGEGRNWTQNTDKNLAYTGKIEVYPLGAFTRNGDMFEGDLMRERKPKLLISGAYHQNNGSKKTQGQTGDELYSPKTTQSILLDGVFKYNGWAFMSAYMKRIAGNPLSFDPTGTGAMRYAFAGEGMDFQGSYIFKSNYELLGRYSFQQVHQDIHPYTPHTQQVSAGVTKYIWEHAFKLQAELTYELQDYLLGQNKQNWYARFQVEMGI